MKKTAILLLLALVLAFFSPLAAHSARAEETAESPANAQEGAEQTPEQSLKTIVDSQPIMALIYLQDMYALQSAPAQNSGDVVVVPSGQQVQIQQIYLDENGLAWAKVTLEFNDTAYEGFAERRFLACADERFLAWENQHGMAAPQGRAGLARAMPADVAQFPQSYQQSLLNMKNAHPNWTFVKMNTGLEWAAVVASQMEGAKSLVPNSFDDYMKNGPYGTQGWSYASEIAVKYYLDPRNWLNEEYLFQFEQLTYNASYHSEGAVQSFLNGTFMQGTVLGDSRSYARLFWEVGQSLGVSPFHLASRAYSEQGANGTSALISGTYPGYEGLYNYYNISASGSTNHAVVTSGLAKAREKGWTSPALSIYGGADIISSNYIRKGQDTVYLQKFDVDPNHNGLFWHQYMQSVFAPASEARSIRSLYKSVNALNNPFVFKIPVYNNMPQDACVLPVTSYNISLTPPAGYTNASVFLDGVEHSAVAQNGSFVVNAGGGHATNAVMYKYNDAGVPIGMCVWLLNYRNGIYTPTPMPQFEDLLTYHGFSVRVTGGSGIRFKTGIATAAKSQLTTGGLAGWVLKEYGTLVMNSANRPQYPFVRNGDKVMSGVSYGNAGGNFIDAVYEEVGGRYRYTSVLVGLPAAQYKTDFAFRGYIVLTNAGVDTVLYGPPVAKSIYTLAQQVLAAGEFGQGTAADAFLRRILQDAGG